MNKKQRTSLINAGWRLLDSSFNAKTNVVKVNVGNTLQHETAKFIKSFELIKGGHTIITEAIFKNGGRADIFCIDTLQIFEILHSEKLSDAQKKEGYYPEECEIFYLKSEEVLNEKTT